MLINLLTIYEKVEYGMADATYLTEKAFSSVDKARKYAEDKIGALDGEYISSSWVGNNENYVVEIRGIEYEE